MHGNLKVLEQLNAALKGELTTILQYIVHAEMCNNWGYQRMGGYLKKQAVEEMKHAEGLIERILFLDGTPQVEVMPGPKIGEDVKAQLDHDLAGEVAAIVQYNRAVTVCSEAGDNATRALFERMVADEERHADYLESQLFMIGEVGLDNYLAQQIH